MTLTQPSRASLAGLIPLISNPDIPERQKQDLRSAVRTIARLMGGAPDSFAADPVALRRQMEGMSAEALGFVRPMLPSRSTQPLLPDWERLLAGLGQSKRFRLAPALRRLGAQGIGPVEVTSAHLEEYRQSLLSDRLAWPANRAPDAPGSLYPAMVDFSRVVQG